MQQRRDDACRFLLAPMIQIRVSFEVPLAERSDFVEASREVMEKSRSESGCLYYCFSADLNESTRFHLTEEWDSEQQLQAHLRTSHFATFVSFLGHCKAQRMTQARSGDLIPYQLRPRNSEQ